MAIVNNSKRLLLASRIGHQLTRTQQVSVDLQQLLGDEVFARALFVSVREVNISPELATLFDDFEKESLETGAWSAKKVRSAPSYAVNANGLVSAAAAWDPNFVPPPATPMQEEVLREPTTTPRVSTVVKERGSSGFFSKFGLSRPAESASVPAGVEYKSTQTPPDPSAPLDPNQKKYIRGAR